MTNTRHNGYTLIEIIVVMALIALLGAILVPTLTSVEGDRPIKAAGDLIRARMAEARSRAMDDGITYRLALSQDGRRVRVAPDDPAFTDAGPHDDDTAGPLISDNVLPKTVTARVISDEAGDATVDQFGWTRIATFEPLGTCRETVVELELTQPGTYALIVRLRGLTGSVQMIKRTKSGGTK